VKDESMDYDEDQQEETNIDNDDVSGWLSFIYLI
jgi:hypothetical protein